MWCQRSLSLTCITAEFRHDVDLQHAVASVASHPVKVLSADLTTIGADQPECLAMVMNKEVVAIAQDSAGLPGKLVHQATNLSASAPATAIRTWNIVEQAWARNVTDAGGGLVVCLFNRDESSRNMSLSWEQLGLPTHPRQRKVRNVWRAENANAAGGVSALVPKHGVVLLKIDP